MKKVIVRNQDIPAFHCIAYRDIGRDVAICYPFPFHWVVRKMREFVMVFARPKYSWVEARDYAIRNAGYTDGYSDASVLVKAEQELIFKKRFIEELERRYEEYKKEKTLLAKKESKAIIRE